MYISWEEMPRHEIPDGAVVRKILLGEWHARTQVLAHAVETVYVAIERCSVSRCTAIASVHPLSLGAAAPHDFT